MGMGMGKYFTFGPADYVVYVLHLKIIFFSARKPTAFIIQHCDIYTLFFYGNLCTELGLTISIFINIYNSLIHLLTERFVGKYLQLWNLTDLTYFYVPYVLLYRQRNITSTTDWHFEEKS